MRSSRLPPALQNESIAAIIDELALLANIQVALYPCGGEPPPQPGQICLPLWYGGEAVASVVCVGERDDLATVGDAVVRRLAQQLVIAAENESLVNEILHSYDVLHAIYGLTEMLGQAFDLERIGVLVTEHLLEPLNALSVAVLLTENQRDRELTRRNRTGQLLLGANQRAAARSPLIVDGQQIGEIAVRGKKTNADFSSADLKLLDSVAIITASAIRHAQLHGRDLARCDQVLQQVAAATPDPRAILEQIAASVGAVFGFGQVECWIYEDNDLVLYGSHGELERPQRVSLAVGMCADVLLAQRARLAECKSYDQPDLPLVRGAVSRMCVPIRRTGAIVGLLHVASAQQLRQHDLRLIESVMVQVNMALENAWLLAEIRRTNDELIQTSKLAAIGTLAAGVAHEFNNLLASIRGFTDLAASSMIDPEMAYGMIQRATVRGADITRSLLTFSRPSPVNREHLLLVNLIEEALQLIKPDFDRLGIAIDRQFHTGGAILSDPTQIVQVLLNLFTNARDAMLDAPRGRLTLVLSEDERDVRLDVYDTGCGIDSAIIHRIFEPFVTTKGGLGGSDVKGTGLGLSVSYSMLTSHGGTLGVESLPGAGSCFTITLPRIDGLPRRMLPRESLEITPTADLTILLVEDDHDVRLVTSTLLRRLGHRVTEAVDGRAAIEQLGRAPWDVIVTDLRMPYIDGERLARQVRSQLGATPVVLTTGQYDGTSHALLNERVVDAVLPKPFSLEELLRTLARVTGAAADQIAPLLPLQIRGG